VEYLVNIIYIFCHNNIRNVIMALTINPLILFGVVISVFFLTGSIIKYTFSSTKQSGGSESSLDNYY
jgi:hypothetical protein